MPAVTNTRMPHPTKRAFAGRSGGADNDDDDDDGVNLPSTAEFDALVVAGFRPPISVLPVKNMPSKANNKTSTAEFTAHSGAAAAAKPSPGSEANDLALLLEVAWPGSDASDFALVATVPGSRDAAVL